MLSVSPGNAVPKMDFSKLELVGVAIVQESLVDGEDFAHMFRSLVSLFSSSEELFCMDFSGKSVLLEAFFEELPVSLGCNVSEMLGGSI